MEKFLTKPYFIKLSIWIFFAISPFIALLILNYFLNFSETNYNLIIGGIISLLTGVLGAYIFLRVYLFNKKPKIKISANISKVNFQGETNYMFKFINVSDVELYDVKIEAKILTPFNDPTGQNLRGEEINFVNSNIYFLPCKNKHDNFNLHALRVRTTDDIETKWDNCSDSSFIRLTIIAKHSLSGFNKVFVKDFLHKNVITHKEFIKGDSLDVK